MADARLAQFPDVATFKEQGVAWTLGTLRGLAAPKDTPPARVQVLAAAVRRVVLGDAYQSAMRSAGFTPAYEDPAQLERTLGQTDERLGALLRSEAFRGLAEKQLGPMFFPALLIGALLLVSAALLVTRRSRELEPRDSPPAPPGAGWRFAEVLIWIALYTALAETLGFVLTAGALLLAHLLRLGTRAAIAIPLAVLLVPAAYHVFAVVLRVPLPRGLLGW
jgi:hypothetical protein